MTSGGGSGGGLGGMSLVMGFKVSKDTNHLSCSLFLFVDGNVSSQLLL